MGVHGLPTLPAPRGTSRPSGFVGDRTAAVCFPSRLSRRRWPIGCDVRLSAVRSEADQDPSTWCLRPRRCTAATSLNGPSRASPESDGRRGGGGSPGEETVAGCPDQSVTYEPAAQPNSACRPVRWKLCLSGLLLFLATVSHCDRTTVPPELPVPGPGASRARWLPFVGLPRRMRRPSPCWLPVQQGRVGGLSRQWRVCQ